MAGAAITATILIVDAYLPMSLHVYRIEWGSLHIATTIKMAYEIRWKSNGLIKRFFDHCSNKDLVTAASIVQSDSRVDGINHVIIDFSDCTGLSVTDPALLEAIAIDEIVLLRTHACQIGGQGIKVAAIAPDSNIMHLVAQYTSFEPQISVRAFQAESDARNWIGISNQTGG